MAKVINSKIRTYYILKALLDRTDDNHRLSTSDLIAVVQSHGLTIERKSVYDDIESLKMMGFDILYTKEKPAGYYIGARNFDVAELKLLVDAVQSSKFITKKKSQELIGKLKGLTNEYEGANLERQVYVIDRAKSKNESIFYGVDMVHEGIINDKEISFTYHRWNINKELEAKNNGKEYKVSPWALTWDAENYYLIAYDAKADLIKYYRVDKMKSIKVLKTPRKGYEAYKDFDISKFAIRTFNMWGAESECIGLRFNNELINAVIDRFGTDITIVPDGDKHFRVTLDISVSNQFYGWLVALGPDAVITYPEHVREGYEKFLRKCLKNSRSQNKLK